MRTKAPSVLHIYEPATGGVPAYVRMLVAHQESRFHHVDYAHQTAHITRAGRGANPLVRFWRGSKQAVDRSRPDIVHLHSSVASALAPTFERQRIPVIYQPHGWAMYRYGERPLVGLAVRRLQAAALRKVDRVLCLSPHEVATGRRLGVPVDHLELIPPAVRPVAHGGDDTSRLDGVRHGAPAQLVFVGRWGAQKGGDLLPSIAEATEGEAVVNVAGIDASRLSGRPNLQALGQHDDVPSLLSHSDIFIQPSRWEGLSLAMLEAMLAGLPIVTFAVSGAEHVERAGCGAVVPQGDLDRFIDEIQRRVRDEDLRRHEGKRARAYATEQISIRRLVDRIEQIYEELICT